MKTIREWITTLDQPYRNMALNMLTAYDREKGQYIRDRAFLKEISLSEAVLGAFEWKSSPQGHDFWGRLYTKLVKVERGLLSEVD